MAGAKRGRDDGDHGRSNKKNRVFDFSFEGQDAWLQRYKPLYEACKTSTSNYITRKNAIAPVPERIAKSQSHLLKDPDIPFAPTDVVLAIAAVWAGLAEISYPYQVSLYAPWIDTVKPDAADAIILPIHQDWYPEGSIIHQLVICEQARPVGSVVRFHLIQSIRVPIDMEEPVQILDTIKWKVSNGQRVNLKKRMVKHLDHQSRIVEKFEWDLLNVPYDTDNNPGNVERSGLCTVLNAWAYLLDIPCRRVSPMFPEPALIYHHLCWRHVWQLAQLALEGQLDYQTIKAFLQGCGYAMDDKAAKQYRYITDERAVRALEGFRSVRMNNKILDELLVLRPRTTQPIPPPLKPRPLAEPAPMGPQEKGLQATKSQATGPQVTGPQATGPRATGPQATGPQATGPSTQQENLPNTNFPVLPSPISKHGPRVPLGDVTDWRKYMRDRFTEFEVKRNSNGIGNAMQLPTDNQELRESDVICAIASLWMPLWNTHKPEYRYGFGTPLAYQINRRDETATIMSELVVGVSRPLIMPIIFTVQDFSLVKLLSGKERDDFIKANGSTGHWGLAVADLTPQNTIRIIHLDSSPETIDKADIEEAARNIVRHSGWCGRTLDDSGAPRAVPFDGSLKFEANVWRTSLVQTDLTMCGIFVILKSWCRMLGIPIFVNKDRRAPRRKTWRDSEREFRRDARRMINLALVGYMDSTTFQAFANCYGVTGTMQEFGSTEERVLEVDMMRVTEEELENFISEFLGADQGRDKGYMF